MALRVAAARGDLWLDEIWTVELARAAGSAAGVLAGLHHDNNHHLNTLWALLAGEGGSALAYRLLALASSAAMLALAALRPLAPGRREAVTGAVLLSFSTLLVHYGSEARGYAPAMLFALAGYQALDRWLETGRRGFALAFAAAGTLGVLSHLTFLFALAGFGAWAVAELVRTRPERARDPVALALLAAPFVALAALWAVDLRHLRIGGGPPYRIAEVLRDLSRAVLGLPRGPLELLAVPVALAAGWEVAALARARDPRWVFFASTLVVAPGLLLATTTPQFLAPRYFLVGAPFLLLLFGRALCRLAGAGRAGRRAWALALVLFCAANAAPLARLLRDGRGRYSEAVAWMLARTPGEVVTVGSDHAFRNGLVLAYHAARAGDPRPLVYVDPGPAVEPPLWYLRHDFSEAPDAAPEISVAGRRYALAARFPTAGLSGWTWLLYRRESAGGSGSPRLPATGSRPTRGS